MAIGDLVWFDKTLQRWDLTTEAYCRQTEPEICTLIMVVLRSWFIPRPGPIETWFELKRETPNAANHDNEIAVQGRLPLEVSMNIKCIGCYELRRRELNMSHGVEVIYECERYFPYTTTIGGLLHPAIGTLEAVNNCPEDPLSHCAICSNTKISHYGQDIVSICKDHATAWNKWLDEHPKRRSYLAPKGRSRKANWVEVFREFVEDMRLQAEGHGKLET